MNLASPVNAPTAVARGRAHRRRVRVVLAVVSAGWALVMQRFGRGDIYWVVGLYALTAIGVVTALQGRTLRNALRPSRSLVAIGAAVVVVMTAATYPAFWVTAWAFPDLAPNVASLYLAAWTETPATALAWTMVILAGEEVLWRGAWVEAWTPRLGLIGAGCLSVLGFGLTQWGSGSALVALVATVCGATWTATRVRTGSVIPGLVAHAIWTPILIFFATVIG